MSVCERESERARERERERRLEPQSSCTLRIFDEQDELEDKEHSDQDEQSTDKPRLSYGHALIGQRADGTISGSV